jgi:hypothetical protein
MDRDRIKDIQLGDRKFQLGRLSASDGNQVIRHFLMYNILPKVTSHDDNEPVTEGILSLAITPVLSQLDELTFARIQYRCFAVCREYVRRGELDGPWPLTRPDGKPEVDELDAPTSLALLTASLTFNLLPFFAPGALKMLRTLYPDPSQSNAPETMKDGTSSGGL